MNIKTLDFFKSIEQSVVYHLTNSENHWELFNLKKQKEFAEFCFCSNLINKDILYSNNSTNEQLFRLLVHCYPISNFYENANHAIFEMIQKYTKTTSDKMELSKLFHFVVSLYEFDFHPAYFNLEQALEQLNIKVTHNDIIKIFSNEENIDKAFTLINGVGKNNNSQVSQLFYKDLDFQKQLIIIIEKHVKNNSDFQDEWQSILNMYLFEIKNNCQK